ncbi:MAG TPA: phosphoribosyltransferase family protein [Gaiellales bacterium]|nr:phosphoribosyltransferase family protein [Gaiellales bacterium]
MTESVQPVREEPWGMRPRAFANRREAGRYLAEHLRTASIDSGVVVGLARGGVEVAAEISSRLGLPLDALAVRKVGHPLQPEYAIGAACPGMEPYVRRDVDLSPAELDHAVRQAQARAAALDAYLHREVQPLSVAGSTCVLVDDGLATGATMIAAIDWARRHGARRVIAAVPVGAPPTLRRLETIADQVVCLEAPEQLFAVGEWYADFGQVSDDRVIALLKDAARAERRGSVVVEAGALLFPGDLAVPAHPAGTIVFAHGSGSSRHSPRNQHVADQLNQAGFATLLFDLLTPAEALNRSRVFDIPLLAERLTGASVWLQRCAAVADLPFAYFGASTGAAAALWAAAHTPGVSAVVSRGGRPDLASSVLSDVSAPTMLIVGGDDREVLALNRRALAQLRCESELVVVPGATHLFEEPGALERVADEAARWFGAHVGFGGL